MSWFSCECDEDVYAKQTLEGYEIVAIVWLDTCPYDANAEFVVCYENIEFDEEVDSLDKAIDYFRDSLNDSCIIKDSCSFDEAKTFIENFIKKK